MADWTETAMGLGNDRSWLTPPGETSMSPTRLSDGSKMVGTHSGAHLGLNVVPRPGYECQWVNAREADVHAAESRGWTIARRGGECRPAYTDEQVADPAGGSTPLDSRYLFNHDLVLMEIPAERLAALRERDHANSIAQINSSGRAWAESASPEERMGSGGSKETRLVRNRHQIAIEEDGQTVDMLRESVPRDAEY